jgi:PWWP domain
MEDKIKIVWAKLNGYPWWPGIVKPRKLDSFLIKERVMHKRVLFIGDNS